MELKEVWKDRKLKGILVKVVDNPAMAVIAQQCGMDFVYSCEHGVLSYEKLHDLMVMANGRGFPSVVRVPQLARAVCPRNLLDYGASGVMVPMIETREQAELLAGWSKYPPVEKEAIPAEPIRITAPAADMHRIWKR